MQPIYKLDRSSNLYLRYKIRESNRLVKNIHNFSELNSELTFLPIGTFTFRNQIEILTTRQGKSINSIYNYARLQHPYGLRQLVYFHKQFAIRLVFCFKKFVGIIVNMLQLIIVKLFFGLARCGLVMNIKILLKRVCISSNHTKQRHTYDKKK